MLRKKLGTEAIEQNWLWTCRLENYFKIPSSLIIPDRCVKIGMYAFRGCKRLKELVIPKSVEGIGYCAFWGCKNATITLKKPKKEFKYLNSVAFDGCKDVEEEI